MSPAPRRTVVVTGASSGIGRALAIRFGRSGARVALAARTVKALEVTAREVERAGGEALVVGTDVRDWDDVQRLAARVKDAWGSVDVLVNNAGTSASAPVKDLSVEDWREQIDTNLTGYFLVAKAFLPLMLDGATRERPRTIVMVASVSGLDGMAGLSGYCASKFGVRGLSLSLAQEVADDGIRVTCVNPGYVVSAMSHGGPAENEMVQADEFAEFVHWLADAPPSMMLDEVTVWPYRMYTQ